LDLKAPEEVVVLAPVQEYDGEQRVGPGRVPPQAPCRQDEDQGCGGQSYGVDVGGDPEVGTVRCGQHQVHEFGKRQTVLVVPFPQPGGTDGFVAAEYRDEVPVVPPRDVAREVPDVA
jgi:hypothetical protein